MSINRIEAHFGGKSKKSHLIILSSRRRSKGMPRIEARGTVELCACEHRAFGGIVTDRRSDHRHLRSAPPCPRQSRLRIAMHSSATFNITVAASPDVFRNASASGNSPGPAQRHDFRVSPRQSARNGALRSQHFRLVQLHRLPHAMERASACAL